MTTTDKARMDANLAAAIIIASKEEALDLRDLTQEKSNLVARINGDKSHPELEKYDDTIYTMSLAATSGCLWSLTDDQCVAAMVHIITNIDKYPATSDKKQYFESLCAAADHPAEIMINKQFINRMRW